VAEPNLRLNAEEKMKIMKTCILPSAFPLKTKVLIN
jgi:hypothetical protein